MKLESVLQKFVCTEEWPEVLQKPFTQGDYVYASDKYIILRVKKELTETEYPVSDTPNCSRVFEGLETPGHWRIVTRKNVERAYSKVPLVDRKCPECHGDGFVEWNYEEQNGHVHFLDEKCPVCYGTGHIRGEKQSDYSYSFQVDRWFANVRLFVKLMEAAHIMGLDEVPIYHAEVGCKFYFKLAEGVDGVIVCGTEGKKFIKLQLLEKGGEK